MTVFKIPFITVLCAITAQADLVFEAPDVLKKAKPGEQQLVIEYPFENKGEQPVSIVGWDAPCSCLNAEIHPPEFAKKEPIPPGTKGFVRATFSIGNFSGTVEKAIGLFYQEGKTEPDQYLKMQVEIPVLFDIQPKTLKWSLGKDKAPQSFKIKVSHEKPIHILSAATTNQEFTYEIKTITDGWEYDVVVTPKAETPGFGILRFKTDCTVAGQESHQAFMVVQQAQ